MFTKHLGLKQYTAAITLFAFLAMVAVVPSTQASPGPCKYCSGYSYNGGVGTGDGICGLCEDVVKTWTLGSCVSGGSGSCDDSIEYYTRVRDVYLCDASGWQIAAGVALTVACAAALGGGALLCIPVCVAPPWLQCIACWLALGAVEGTCGCTISELFCPCSLSHSENEEPDTGCIS